MAIWLSLWATVALAEALTCPAGSMLLRHPRLDGLVEEVCETPSGVRHGAGRIVASDGTVRSTGGWLGGLRDGKWKFYDESGRSHEVGSYRLGQRVGVWTTLKPDGTPAATLFHQALAAGPDGESSTGPHVRWRTPLDSLGGVESLTREGPTSRASVARAERWGGLGVVWNDESILVVEPSNGDVLWRAVPPSGVRGDVVLGERHVSAVTTSGMVLVIDHARRSSRRIRTPVGATHVAGVAGDTVWVRDGVGRLAAWDARDGTTRWVVRRVVSAVAPVLANQRVVAGRGRDVVGVDRTTGKASWQTRLDSPVVSIWSGDSGTILAVTKSGAIERLDAHDGRPIESLRTPDMGEDAAVWFRDGSAGVQYRSMGAVGWLGGRSWGGFHGRPDLGAGLACGGDSDATLMCLGDVLGEYGVVVPSVSVAGAVARLGDMLLVPTAGALVGVDLNVVRALGGTGTAEVVGLLADADGSVTEVRLPYGVVSRTDAESGCTSHNGVVGLDPVRPAQDGLADGQSVELNLQLPELVVDAGPEGSSWALGEAWTGEVTESRWDATYALWWRPELVSVFPFDATPASIAALDQSLLCDGPAVEFRGQAVLRLAGSRRVYEGKLQLEPWPHEVLGRLGCLVNVFVDDAPIGAYRPENESAWAEIALTVSGVDAIVTSGEAIQDLPTAIVPDWMTVDLWFPGDSERTFIELDQPVSLVLEDAWPAGLDLVFREQDEGGTERLRIPADDVFAIDEPLATEWWTVGRSIDVMPARGTTSVVWSRTDCPERLPSVVEPTEMAAPPPP